jgi:hypothetical protein
MMIISINNLVGSIGPIIFKNCTYSVTIILLYLISRDKPDDNKTTALNGWNVRFYNRGKV